MRAPVSALAIISFLFLCFASPASSVSFTQDDPPGACSEQFDIFADSTSNIQVTSSTGPTQLQIVAAKASGSVCLVSGSCYSASSATVGVVVAYQNTMNALFNLEFSASPNNAEVRVDDITYEGSTVWIAGGVEDYAGLVNVTMKDHSTAGSPVLATASVSASGTVGAWFLASIDLDGTNGWMEVVNTFTAETKASGSAADLKIAATADTVKMCGSVESGTVPSYPCSCCALPGVSLSRTCTEFDTSAMAVDSYDNVCGGEVLGGLTSDGQRFFIAETSSANGMTVHDFDGNIVSFTWTLDPPLATALAYNPVTDEILLGCTFRFAFSGTGFSFTNPTPSIQNGAIIHIVKSPISPSLESRLGHEIRSPRVFSIRTISPDGEGNFYFGGSATVGSITACNSDPPGQDALVFQGQCIGISYSSRRVGFYGMVRGLILSDDPVPKSPIFRAIVSAGTAALGVEIASIAVNTETTNKAMLATDLLSGTSDFEFVNADSALAQCDASTGDNAFRSAAPAMFLATLILPDRLEALGCDSQFEKIATAGRAAPEPGDTVTVDRMAHSITADGFSHVYTAGTFRGAADFGSVGSPARRVNPLVPRGRDVYVSARVNQKLTWFAHFGTPEDDQVSDISASSTHVFVTFYYSFTPVSLSAKEAALEVATWTTNGFSVNECMTGPFPDPFDLSSEGHSIIIVSIDSDTGECVAASRTKNTSICDLIPSVPYGLAATSGGAYLYLSVSATANYNLFGISFPVPSGCEAHIFSFDNDFSVKITERHTRVGATNIYASGLTHASGNTYIGLSLDTTSANVQTFRLVVFSTPGFPIAVDDTCLAANLSPGGIALGADIVSDSSRLYFSIDRKGATDLFYFGSSSAAPASNTDLVSTLLTNICGGDSQFTFFSSPTAPKPRTEQLAINPYIPAGVWLAIPASNQIDVNGADSIDLGLVKRFSAIYHVNGVAVTVPLILERPELQSLVYTDSEAIHYGGTIASEKTILVVDSDGTELCESNEPFVGNGGFWSQMNDPNEAPSATPTISETPTVTRTPTRTVTPSNTMTSSMTPSPSSTRSPTPSPSNSFSPTRTAPSTASATTSASESVSPTETGSLTATSTGTPSPTALATTTSTKTITATPTPAATRSSSSSGTMTATSTGSVTPSPSGSTTATATPTPTGTSSTSGTTTPSSTASETASSSPTPSSSSSSTLSQTPTASAATSPTSSVTPSSSASATSSGTASSSLTRTSSPTHSATISGTSSETVTPTVLPSQSPTPSATHTSSSTATGTETGTMTTTPSRTMTGSESRSRSSSATVTSLATASQSQRATSTQSSSPTGSSTLSRTSTPTGTMTSTGTGASTGSGTVSPLASVSATSTVSGTMTGSASSSSTTTGTASPTATSSASASPSKSPSKSRSDSSSTTPAGVVAGVSASNAPVAKSKSAQVAAPVPASRSPSPLPSLAGGGGTVTPPSRSASRTRSIIPFMTTTIARSRSNQVVLIGGDGVPSGFDCEVATQESVASAGDAARFLCGDSDTPFLEVTVRDTTELVIVRPGDEELINSAGNEVLIASPVLDITAGASYSGEAVELCLALDESAYEDADPDEACLGFIDESEEPPEWKCQDFCLSTNSEGLFCGETDHFTNFAILLDGAGAGDSGRCGSSSEDWITGESWGDIVLFLGAILVCCMIAVVVIVAGTFVRPLHAFIVGEEASRLETLRGRKLESSA